MLAGTQGICEEFFPYPKIAPLIRRSRHIILRGVLPNERMVDPAWRVPFLLPDILWDPWGAPKKDAPR